MEKFKIRYSARELSFFCRQIALLLGGAIPLDEGLYLMAEEANGEEEKRLLQWLGEEVELGMPFSQALEEAEVYPSYLVRMAPLAFFRREIRSVFLRSFLYYVQFAMLGAMTFPAIFFSTTYIWSGIAGAAVALLLAYFRRGLLVVSVASIVTVFLVEQIFLLLQ